MRQNPPYIQSLKSDLNYYYYTIVIFIMILCYIQIVINASVINYISLYVPKMFVYITPE